MIFPICVSAPQAPEPFAQQSTLLAHRNGPCKNDRDLREMNWRLGYHEWSMLGA